MVDCAPSPSSLSCHGALACSLVVVELGEALSPLEQNPGEVRSLSLLSHFLDLFL